MTSSYGPTTDPDALRKNVNGVWSGFMPTSLTWEAKFAAWATTRHGAVTGETSIRLSTGTVSVLFPAAAMAIWSASSSAVVLALVAIRAAPARSEEHTSELQSQSNLVCRLLLEKKKK